ncbi:MAG TPA: hypothetical protein VKX46_14100 [Ktedonobacteraceae bacterium]|nr:hypothetical protein [Ktedonobacteraceae bacterium]
MARSRSLPTTLFKEPAFFELESDTQTVLLGLVLLADDHGRGLAHTGLLAREFNKPIAVIEWALPQLEHSRLLHCYVVDGQRYYWLPQWTEWETLSKPARSRFPAPPTADELPRPAAPTCSQKPQGKLGECWNSLHEDEEEGEGKGEKEEEKEQEPEVEGESEQEPEVEEEDELAPIIFLTPSGDGSVATISQEQIRTVTRHTARILKLAVSDALTRVVAEYIALPGLSLLGEADAAREWIEDSRRNRQHKRMTPAFFRGWLKREQEALRQRQAERSQATGTAPSLPMSRPGPSRALSGLPGRSLMQPEAHYRAQYARGKEPHEQTGHSTAER